MLTKKEFTNTNSVFNIFISSNSFGDKNHLSSTSHRFQLNLCRKELSHVTLKDVGVDGGWVRTILASSKTKHIKYLASIVSISLSKIAEFTLII